MAPVILHTGFHETGTTFIQYTPYEKRAKLIDAKVLYPETGLVTSTPEVGVRHLELKRSVASEGAGSYALACERREIDDWGCEIAVISHEALMGEDVEPAAPAVRPLLLSPVRRIGVELAWCCSRDSRYRPQSRSAARFRRLAR